MKQLEAFAADCGLELEPFQRRIVRAARGREREFAALMPRGNGKTHLLAIVALHHLVSVEGAAVYCAAASREQARILFEAAADYARVLSDPHVVFRHLELRWCPDPSEPRRFTRHLRVLAADAPRLHGLTPSLAIIDELQAHADDAVYVALASALHKRPDSKLVVISTAGIGPDSPLGRLRARALAQPKVTRRGAVTDARGPGLHYLEWSVPESADVDDPRAVKRANPASWISVDQLRAARASLPDLAHRRLVGNQWTAVESHWLPPGAWQACAADYTIEAGEPVFVGVDVGGSRAASAVVWVTPDLRIGCQVFQGTEAVLAVAERVRELAGDFDVRELAFDPWRFQQAALELEQEGLRVVEFPQSQARMVAASERLHGAVVEGRLKHPNDPELNGHVAAAVAKDTPRGWRLDKSDRTAQIDAVVALAMAVERAELPQPKPTRLLGWL